MEDKPRVKRPAVRKSVYQTLLDRFQIEHSLFMSLHSDRFAVTVEALSVFFHTFLADLSPYSHTSSQLCCFSSYQSISKQHTTNQQHSV
jgi:hypothetical protein